MQPEKQLGHRNEDFMNPQNDKTPITLMSTSLDKALLERLAQQDASESAAAVSMSATFRKLIREEAQRRGLVKPESQPA